MTDKHTQLATDIKRLITETKRRNFTKLSTIYRKSKKKHDILKEVFRDGSSAYTETARTGGLYVDDYDYVRQAGNEAKTALFGMRETKHQLDALKNEHAARAAEIGNLAEQFGLETGEFIAYDGDTLGALVRVADFPSGSREWLEARQLGIGGSDVGNILMLDPDWGRSDFTECFNSKTLPITDEQVEEQLAGQVDFTNPAARGNAWEPLLGKFFADAYPEMQTFICKASWAKRYEPIMRVNFDFLLARTRGETVPTGLLEIKTANDPSKWGDIADGLDAVPPKYRAQVLHGILHSGGALTWGAIAVLIDGHDFRVYFFEMTEKLMEEARANAEASRRFWERVIEFNDRAEFQTNNDTEDAPKAVKSPVKGFAAGLSNRGHNADANRVKMLIEIAQIAGKDPRELVKRYHTLRSTSGTHENSGGQKAFFNLYRAVLTELVVDEPKVISIDLETSGNSPISGSIIELGASVCDITTGNEIEAVQELYGLSELEIAHGGTGAEDVHHISLEDIKGKPLFSDPENTKRMLELLKSGIVIAHNKSFELSWFRQCIPGFVEAEIAGEIRMIDTMDLCKKFLITAPGNRLQDFVEFFGDTYEEAHRALQDSRMTAVAFFKFLEWIKKSS